MYRSPGAQPQARLAFAGETNARALLHAGRNRDRQRLLAPDPALTAADAARILDHPAGAAAGRARPLDGEEALLGAHLAVAVAGRAGDRPRTGFAATAMAPLAADRGRHADLRVAAAEGILEADFEIVAQVAAPGARLGAASADELAEHLVENIGKAAAETEIRGARAAAAILERSVTEAVIGRPLLVILQDIVGFTDIFKLLLGCLVARIAIRVKLHRELPVRLLHFVGGRAPRYAE